MNKELTKEEAEEYYNKLWLENKDLIQENIERLDKKRFALEMELIDKGKEIERLNNIINELETYIGIKMSSFGVCNASDIYYKLQELKGSDKAIPPEIIGTNGEDGGLFDYGDR